MYDVYHITAKGRFIVYCGKGGGKVDASRIFKIFRDMIYRWLGLDDLVPKRLPKTRHRKIDKQAASLDASC